MAFKNHGPGGCCCYACYNAKIPDWGGGRINPNCLSQWHFAVWRYYMDDAPDAFRQEGRFHVGDCNIGTNYEAGNEWTLKDWPDCLEHSGTAGRWVRFNQEPKDIYQSPNGFIANCEEPTPVPAREATAGDVHTFYIEGDAAKFTLVAGSSNYFSFQHYVGDCYRFDISGSTAKITPANWQHNSYLDRPWALNRGRYPHNVATCVAPIEKGFTPSEDGRIKVQVHTERWRGDEPENNSQMHGWVHYWQSHFPDVGIINISVNGTDIIRTHNNWGNFGFSKTPLGSPLEERDEAASDGWLVNTNFVRIYPMEHDKTDFDEGTLKISGIESKKRMVPRDDILTNPFRRCQPSDPYGDLPAERYELSDECVSERFRDGIPYLHCVDGTKEAPIPKTAEISGFNCCVSGVYDCLVMENALNPMFRPVKTQRGFYLDGLAVYSDPGYINNISAVTDGGWTYGWDRVTLGVNIYQGRLHVMLTYRANRSPIEIPYVPPTGTLIQRIDRPIYDPAEHDSKEILINAETATSHRQSPYVSGAPVSSIWNWDESSYGLLWDAILDDDWEIKLTFE